MVIRDNGALHGLERANQATARLLRELAKRAQPGVTTRELDQFATEYILGLGAEPVFHTEAGFPGSINTNVNDVAVHGVPNDTQLRAGDVLSIDAGMLLDGYCGDSTITVPIGRVDPGRSRLINTTRQAMLEGIKAAQPGKRVGDIGYAIQKFAESRGYGVVREFIGHGLGTHMHEPPNVPSVGRAGTGPLLEEGLVITIEPILVEGSPVVHVDTDGWTVRTRDGGWAAQFEHTVVVGHPRARILSHP